MAMPRTSKLVWATSAARERSRCEVTVAGPLAGVAEEPGAVVVTEAAHSTQGDGEVAVDAAAAEGAASGASGAIGARSCSGEAASAAHRGRATGRGIR